jgi:hypothetical protein
MNYRYKFISVENRSNGSSSVYFRRERGQRIRLPDMSDPQFQKHYMAALSGESTYQPVRRSKRDVVRRDSGNSLIRGLRSAKARAFSRGLPFDLDWDWAEQQLEKQRFRCPMTGLAFFMKRSDEGTKNPFAPSIDRIDPRLGYTKANCRIIIFAMNAMLSDWGECVLQSVMDGYRSKQEENARCPQIITGCPQPKKSSTIPKG